MITILMPVYNGIEFIDQSVQSIIEQTYKDWELIIGINGHVKGSDVYLQANKHQSTKISVYDMTGLVGKGRTLNNMLKYAKFDWIALIDVDDIWYKGKLASQIEYMKTYDVIGTQCRYFGDLNICPNIPFGDISKFDFKTVNPIINSSCLIRKNLCKWCEDKDGIEDYDMWLRLRYNNMKFYNIRNIQVLHRIHERSAFNSKGNADMAKELINI